MFTNGKITVEKVTGYYVLFLLVAVAISLSFFRNFDVFIKSAFVSDIAIGLSALGLLYVCTISKLKDVLYVRMYNTERYNTIYKDAMQSRTVKQKARELFYTDKLGPLNHFVDMVRSCGWTMFLSYFLIIVLNSYDDSFLFNSLALLFFVGSILSGVISSYYIYQNISVLRRFLKNKEA